MLFAKFNSSQITWRQNKKWNQSFFMFEF
jgi:hypothetical protein